MSVLIFTPTIGDQLRPQTRASIEGQQTTIEYEWEIGYHNPFPGNKIANVIAQYQRARAIFLASGHDAMLTVEDDMIIPPNALQSLHDSDGGVVYGVYLFRHGTPTLSAWRYIDRRRMGTTLSMYPHETEVYRQRGWAKVSGVGWGCTLIRREVLGRIAFRSKDKGDAGDVGFAGDCIAAGIEQIARFDVLCGHICEDGEVLWPFQTGGIIGRVYALRNAPTGFYDIEKPMKKGRYYSMPIERAQTLRRLGYVTISNLEGGRRATIS